MVNYGGGKSQNKPRIPTSILTRILDEVSALVIDIGSSSVRAGYAGDDTPKAMRRIPHRPAPDDLLRCTWASFGPTVWREGMEVSNPLVDGLVHDFEPASALMRHAVVDIMRCNPSDHPILVTEPAWNTPANRERMAEIMFEEFQVPAFYIANTGVLNAFAAGKGSALVIDVGQTMASVTPIVDGFVLRKGLVYSPLPKLVHAHASSYPCQSQPATTRSRLGAPPRFTLREDRLKATTDSWRNWYEAREVEEWIQSVAGVLEQGWNDQVAASRPAETASNPNLPKTIPALITESLRACDPELRQVLVGNVVLTGGGSLFAGFGDRLSSELARSFPHVKSTRPEILWNVAMLWISKEEWAEHGKAIVRPEMQIAIYLVVY
ncbi:actin-related protein Arp4p [Mycena olivaceomarginata]|nr:actin-related protein Arp4p [Mycena olivaceomarginata]